MKPKSTASPLTLRFARLRARGGKALIPYLMSGFPSRRAFRERPGYGIFGIVQGGVYATLRQGSAATLRAIGFDGYAVGGLAVGEGQATMFRVLDDTVPALPEERPFLEDGPVALFQALNPAPIRNL